MRTDPTPPGDGDGDAHDLVRARIPAGAAGPETLAHLLAQSHHEAAANRAQARELIRALEGVQRSQEYLGAALREERSRSRRLVLLLLAAPLVAGAAVWWVTRRVEEVRGDVESRLATVEAGGRAERATLLAGMKDARLEEIHGDLARLREDLASSRDALASERARVADREQALAAADSRTDSARMEVGALEFELKSAKSRAAAERARADHLETRIRALEEEARSRKEGAAEGAPASPKAVPDSGSALGAVAPAAKAPAPPPSEPAADAAEVERNRSLLNALLRESKDAVRYEFAFVGGLSGRTLRDVHVVGTDAEGRVVRAIRAARAEVTADGRSGSVVLRFFEGKLHVGSVEAPFYDDTYGLVVRGDAQRWSKSGLACLDTL